MLSLSVTVSCCEDELAREALHVNLTILTNVFLLHRSLFEKDKLLFAFLLATRVMRHNGKLPSHEYEFLTSGGAGVGGGELLNLFA